MVQYNATIPHEQPNCIKRENNPFGEAKESTIGKYYNKSFSERKRKLRKREREKRSGRTLKRRRKLVSSSSFPLSYSYSEVSPQKISFPTILSFFNYLKDSLPFIWYPKIFEMSPYWWKTLSRRGKFNPFSDAFPSIALLLSSNLPRTFFMDSVVFRNYVAFPPMSFFH